MDLSRRALLEAVRRRVRDAVDGRSDGLFAVDGVAEAGGLLARTPDLTADVTVARVVGMFFLARTWSGGDDDDLGIALALLAPVWSNDRAAVPESVDELFRDVGTGVAGAAGAWHGPGRALSEHPDALEDVEHRSIVVELMRIALDHADDGDERAMCLTDLAAALQLRYELSGSVADLDEAVALGDEAGSAFVDDDPRRRRPMAAQSVALLRLAREGGSRADLDRAVILGREVVETTPGDDPAGPERWSNLSAALRYRAETAHDRTDADAAVAAGRRAVAASESGDAGRPARLVTLSAALCTRFEVTGRDADLDEAIEIAEAVPVDGVPATVTAANGINRSDALRSRYRRTGRSADLDLAIAAGEAARAVLPPGHPDRVRVASNLGLARHARFGRSGEAADLERAVTDCREAAAHTRTGHPDLPGRLSNLGDVLLTRGEHEGSGVDEAVDVARRAAAIDHPRRALYLSNLGNALLARAERRGDTADADLDEAVAVGSEALDACVPGTAHRAACAANLAVALWDRYERRGDQADGTRAVAVTREAAADRAGPLAVRVRAAARQGSWSAVLGDRVGAAAGSSEAVALLDAVAPRDLPRADQEFELARLGGLASDAAACALQLDHAEDAVRLLERGRGIVLAHAIGERPFGGGDVDRLDLTGLAVDGPVVMVNISRFRSDALLLTPDGLDVVPLPHATPDAVRGLAAAYLVALLRRDHPDATVADLRATEVALIDTLAWLWDRIAQPVLERLGLVADGEGDWSRLWWCPTGSMSVLPLSSAGRRGSGSVLDRVVGSVTPTLRALAHARRPRSGASRMLVVAPEGDRGLPAAARDVETITSTFPGAATLTGSRAMRAAVLDALPRFDRLHMMGHASADLRRPSDGALDLADGPVTAAEFADLRLPDAELAFLAACETARLGPEHGDEVVHLSSTLQAAGYRHVVGTLWTVSDRVASRLTRRVYGAMAADGVAATATHVHAAVRELRRTYPARPSAWAGFQHLGP